MPKQFLRIGHEIILMRTLRIFHDLDASTDLIVVLPEKEMPTWEKLCRDEPFALPHQVVKGGATRFHSVKNGLEKIKTPTLVAVHDGVRPLVSHETISRAFEKAEQDGNAIPVIDIPESIRYIENGTSKSVPRARYKLVQTPQVFQSTILLKAYQQGAAGTDFTDDASLVESMGAPIHVVEGNVENIKITTQKDLELAGLLVHYAER